jgi:hypothetical protein
MRSRGAVTLATMGMAQRQENIFADFQLRKSIGYL